MGGSEASFFSSQRLGRSSLNWVGPGFWVGTELQLVVTHIFLGQMDKQTKQTSTMTIILYQKYHVINILINIYHKYQIYISYIYQLTTNPCWVEFSCLLCCHACQVSHWFHELSHCCCWWPILLDNQQQHDHSIWFLGSTATIWPILGNKRTTTAVDAQQVGPTSRWLLL